MDESKYFEVKGEQTGDYFKFYCGECGSILEMEYLGLDPSVPKFKFTCLKCASSHELKISKFKSI